MRSTVRRVPASDSPSRQPTAVRPPSPQKQGVTSATLQRSPTSLAPHEFLTLQQQVGNRAVQTMLQPTQGAPTTIQRKVVPDGEGKYYDDRDPDKTLFDTEKEAYQHAQKNFRLWEARKLKQMKEELFAPSKSKSKVLKKESPSKSFIASLEKSLLETDKIVESLDQLMKELGSGDLGSLVEEEPSSKFSPLKVPLKKAQERYGALGKEKWREFIRGAHHGSGPTAYDSDGTRFGSKLKNNKKYSSSIQDADDYVGNTLGQPLTLKEYQKIHDLATQHLNPIDFRGKKNDITVTLLESHGEKEGLKELRNQKVLGNSVNPLQIRQEAGPQMTWSGELEYVREHTIAPTAMDKEKVMEATQEILDNYYKAISLTDNPDTLLEIIADTHQRLTRLHPFEDANTRTNLLILNKFLTECGMHPAVINDPKNAYLKKLATWKKEIHEGLLAWEKFGKKVEAVGSELLLKKSNSNDQKGDKGSKDDFDLDDLL